MKKVAKFNLFDKVQYKDQTMEIEGIAVRGGEIFYFLKGRNTAVSENELKTVPN